MTLVQLRHFVALAEHGSYVKASKAAFLTQPALTRSIQALEETLGQALFDRVGRRIELTRFGQDLLARAKQLLHDAEGIRHAGTQGARGQIGRVRVGLSSGPGAVLAVPLLTHMAREHPRLHLEVARGNTDLLLIALRSRQLDAAILDIRSVRPASDLRVSQPVEMAASFMCRADHPLAQGRRRVGLDELLRYPIASTPLSDEVARQLTERYGPQANPDDMVTLRGDDTASLVEAARQSDAIVLTINAAGRDLVRLPVQPAMRATARFGLVTLAHRAEPPALAIVARLMQRVLHDA